MIWEKLTDISQLETVKSDSLNKPVLIFKHSTSCSISATALSRLERNWKDEAAKGIKPYYLDLKSFRDVSNKIASEFHVEHESPQVLLIKNGDCVYNASHLGISFDEILKNA